MKPKHPFKWRHLNRILSCCASGGTCGTPGLPPPGRNDAGTGSEVDHTTVYRWVQAYALELDKRCRIHLKPTNDSWRVDETYIEVKGEWKYLYRAVDSQGNTLDFMLSAKRNAHAAERFFRKALESEHNQSPRVINVEKNAAYPPALDELKADQTLSETTELRRVKYLNNIVELFASSDKTLGQSRNGIWLIQHGEANFERLRSNEHDS